MQLMDGELKQFKKKRSWPDFSYYYGIFLKGIRKTTNAPDRMVGLRATIYNRDLPNLK